MVLVCLIVWSLMAGYMIWINQEELDRLDAPRLVAATVLLTFAAPVFFASDILEMVLDLITGEEDES